MGTIAAQAGWTWAQTAVLLAAIIAVVGASITVVLTYALNQRAARRERQAKAFAEALSAVEDYAELPYRIRRRLGGGEARHHLTEEISKVQSRIAFHQAWLRIEAPRVAVAYDALVLAAKVQAGGQMNQAWTQRLRTMDRQMNLHLAYPRDEIDNKITECVAAMRHLLRRQDTHRGRPKH